MSTSAPHPSKNVLWNSVELFIIIQQFEIKELGKKDSNSIFDKGLSTQKNYKENPTKQSKQKKRKEYIKKREIIFDFVYRIQRKILLMHHHYLAEILPIQR